MTIRIVYDAISDREASRSLASQRSVRRGHLFDIISSCNAFDSNITSQDDVHHSAQKMYIQADKGGEKRRDRKSVV